MLFKKLFQLLVVGGAAVGASVGCAARAQSSADQGNTATPDGGAKSGGRDAGTAPDAGSTKASESGGGVQGW